MLQSRSCGKKLVKPLKNCFLDPICTEKRSLWATPKMENFFGRQIISFPESFYFIKIPCICFDWVMNLFLSWVMFSVQKSVISSENSCAITIEGVRKCNSALPWYTTVKPVVKHGYFWPCWAAWHFAPPFFHGQTIWSRLMVKKD